MSPIRAFGLATAALLAPQLARAADLLPPAPSVEPLRGAIVEESIDPSGWYIRGDVGVAINGVSQTSTFTAANAVVPGFIIDQSSIASSAFVTLGAGYQFNSWLRADLTATLRSGGYYQSSESYTSGFNDLPVGGVPVRNSDNYNANIQSNVFLANGYVDLGTWVGLTPYIGAGVGFATHNVTGLQDIGGVNYTANGVAGAPGYGLAASSSNTSLAWAGMAGVAWNVNKRLKLEIGYRYLDLGSAKSNSISCQPNIAITNCPLETQAYKITSQEVHVGMRWLLGSFGYSDSYSSGAVLPSSAAYGGHGVVVGGAYPSSGKVVGGGYGGGQYVSGGYGGGQVAGGGQAYPQAHY